MQQPLRSIAFGTGASAGTAVLPTCHDFVAAADGFDLLVGLSTGDSKPYALPPTCFLCFPRSSI